MFLIEAETMSMIKNERIVELIDFEITTFSIIMELMPMGSLSHFIFKTPKMEAAVKHQILLDICKGMAFLHSPVDIEGRPKKELFHQDLKSGNVLLSVQDGEVRGKISDFGLSCMNFKSFNTRSYERLHSKRRKRSA